MKYEIRGIGSPRSRLRVLSLRSDAIAIATPWNATAIVPVAAIPAVKYCANGTSVSGTSPLKMDPKISIMITG